MTTNLKKPIRIEYIPAQWKSITKYDTNLIPTFVMNKLKEMTLSHHACYGATPDISVRWSTYTFKTIDWTGTPIAEVCEWIHATTGDNPNVCIIEVVNCTDQICPTSFRRSSLQAGSNIVKLAIGSTRDVIIKHKEREYKYLLPAKNNTLMVLPPEFSNLFTFAVPPRKKVKGCQIWLTFLTVNES